MFCKNMIVDIMIKIIMCALYIIIDNFGVILGLFKIIETIDCDLRTDIYLGVTGFLTAIVIFVAEFVSNDDKSKLDKKVLISKTKIYDNVVWMIINMIALLIGQLIRGIGYYVFQILLNISIGISIYKTVKMFRIIIDLTLRDDLLAIERDQYIKDTFYAYDKKMKNIKKLKEQSEHELESALKANNFISYAKYPYFLDGYKAINSKFDGILKSINLEKMEQILSNFQIENDEKIVYIATAKGEYISRKILFYVKKEYEKYSENILSCFYIEKDEKHLDEDVNKIIKETINKIRYTEYYENIHTEIINFFEDIINYDWKYVEELFYSQLYEIVRESIKLKKYNTMNVLLEYVEDIDLLLIRKNKIEEFEKYYNLRYYLMLEIIDENGIDRENVIYKFTNFINSCIYRCEDNETKETKYDLLLSKVLRVIKLLLRRNSPDAILIILNNMAISSDYGVKKEKWLEKILFQFIIGILYAFLYEFDTLNKNNFIGVKEILAKIKNKFDFDFKYDVYEFISKFNSLKNKENKIYGVYEDFCFGEPEDHKNQNSWSGNSINRNLVLCELFRLYYTIPNDNLNKDLIKKEDKHFCEEMLAFIGNPKYKELFEIFPCNLEINISEIKLAIENIKLIAMEKEEKYEIENELNKEKIENFKKIIFDKIDKENTLLSMFSKDKIEISEEVPEIFLMLEDSFIPRCLFFKDIGGEEYFAEDIAETINNGKIIAITNYLKRNSQKVIDVNSAIKKFDNKNELIIISGAKDYWKTFNFKNTYEYEGICIPIINTNNDFTIVVDKESLPILKYMSFNEKELPEGEIQGNTFIGIADCSDDITLKELMEKNKSLKEEYGNQEKSIKELKKKCFLRVYHSFEIKECENKKIYFIEW